MKRSFVIHTYFHSLFHIIYYLSRRRVSKTNVMITSENWKERTAKTTISQQQFKSFFFSFLNHFSWQVIDAMDGRQIHEKKRKETWREKSRKESADTCVLQTKILIMLIANKKLTISQLQNRMYYNMSKTKSNEMCNCNKLHLTLRSPSSGLPLHERAGLAIQRCLCNRRGTNTMWETVGVAFLMIYQQGAFFPSFRKPRGCWWRFPLLAKNRKLKKKKSILALQHFFSLILIVIRKKIIRV